MAGTITATSQCQDGTEAHNNPSIGSDVRELDLTSSRADYSPSPTSRLATADVVVATGRRAALPVLTCVAVKVGYGITVAKSRCYQ